MLRHIFSLKRSHQNRSRRLTSRLLSTVSPLRSTPADHVQVADKEIALFLRRIKIGA
jgi:hypothetical protein